MLKKLVKEEWWTDTSVVTDSEGYALVEAFKGDYNIAADGMSADIKLTDDSPATVCLKS